MADQHPEVSDAEHSLDVAEAPGEESSTEQVARPQPRQWFRPAVRLLASATAVATLTAIVLAAVTVHLDNDRSVQSDRQAAELTWRTLLVKGATFPGANLADLQLKGLYANEVDISGGDVSDTDLSRGNFVRARFDAVTAQRVNLREARLDEVSFLGADLTDADFENASLERADLREAEIGRASFVGAYLRGTDVRGTDLSRADFTDVDLRYVCWDDGTEWPPGLAPDSRLCLSDPSPKPGGLAERWSLDGVISTPTPKGTPREWGLLGSLTDDNEQEVALEFRNTGVVPVQGIRILVEIDKSMIEFVPGSVRLVDGSFPEGYVFPDTAIQAEGRHIEVQLTNTYPGGSNAWVYFKVRKNPSYASSCQAVTTSIGLWAQPTERGAVNSAVSVGVASPGC